MRFLAPFALCLLVFSTAACERPEPPTVVPLRVRITGLTMTRIDLDVTLEVTNPNAIDLVVRAVDADVVVGGKVSVGHVEIPVTTTLTAKKTTKVDAPLSVAFLDIAPMAQLALSQPKIPYTVDGHVTLGGELLHVTIPFHLQDTVPRELVMKAAMTVIPGLTR